MHHLKKNKNLILWVAALVIVIIIVVLNGDSSSTKDVAVVPATGTSVPASNAVHTAAVKSTPAPVTSTATAGPLDGHSYRISGYNSQAVPSGENYTVTFANGELSTKICNGISGPYTAAYGSMSARLKSTMMGCTSPAGVMQLEQIFNTTLSQKATYAFTGNLLIISGSGNSVFLTQTK